MRLIRMRALLGPFLAVLLASPAGAIDLELYARLLERHTKEVPDLAGVRVDYAALRQSGDWNALVASVEASDPNGLTTRDAQMAYWINVYNILAIELVVKNAPPESIRDIGSFFSPVWKKEAGRLSGRAVTLDEIEHEILRPMGDPRIHGAIVCASLSCPPLARDPYRVDTLAAQLDTNMRRWLSDPRKGVRVDRNTYAVFLSRIFKWFAEDFEAKGGAVAFAARYAPDADAGWLEENGSRAKVEYLDYDWRLNRL